MKSHTLLLLSALLFSALSCVPGKYVVNYEELVEDICAQDRKSCIDSETYLYYVKEGEVFRFYKGVGWAERAGGHDVAEIVGYMNSVIALQDDGTVYILYYHVMEPEREDSWIEIGDTTTSIETSANKLVALKATGEVWDFLEAEPGDRVTFVPRAEYIRRPIVYYTPTVGGHRITFEPTGLAHIASLDKNDLGQVLAIDKDGVSSVLYTEPQTDFAELPMHDEL